MQTKKFSLERNEAKWACLFLAPLVIGLLLFVVVPLVYAIYLSFCEYNLFITKFVGFENFERAFTSDTQFWPAVLNSLKYALFVPITMLIAMVIAYLLCKDFKGAKVYKMVFYLPTICSAVAITFMWKWLYNGEYGLFAVILKKLGLPQVMFLDNEHAMGSMIFMSVWSGLGTSLLLYIAAIKNVPQTCIEAARIDGASSFRIFTKIIFPLISPTSFYLFITGIIGAMQGFATFFAMTGGVSPESIVMPVTIIYMYAGHGWGINTFGYASALALLLGIMIGGLTIVNFIVSKYWVYSND